MASGLAPTAVMLRQASATACLAPSYGSALQYRGVTSVVIASPLLVPCTRTTAASPPGRCTVSAPTMWSYCSQIQRRLATSGEPISVSRSAAISLVSGTLVSGVGGGVFAQG